MMSRELVQTVTVETTWDQSHAAHVLYSEAVPYWEVYNFHLKDLFYNLEMHFRHEMCGSAH